MIPKNCKKCGKSCHITHKTCPHCDEKFITQTKTKKKLRNVKAKKTQQTSIFIYPPQYQEYDIKMSIKAPAGLCPVPLKKIPTETQIEDWAHRCRIHYLENGGMFLLNFALRYFVKEFYPTFSSEWSHICDVINTLPDRIEETQVQGEKECVAF